MLKSRFMFAAAMAACACALHAGRTIETDYTLEADEDWSSEGTVTINAGVVVNLNGHDLRVGGLAGEGRIVSSAELIVNGSFEQIEGATGEWQGFAASGYPTAWTGAYASGNVATHGWGASRNSTWSDQLAAQDGSRSVWWWCQSNTSGGATLMQKVNVVKADVYRLSFYTAYRPHGGVHKDMRLYVDVDGNAIGHVTCSTATWAESSFDVLLDVGEHSVTFRSDGTGGGTNPCGLLDNVSLRRRSSLRLGQSADGTYSSQNISVDGNVIVLAESQTLNGDCDWRALGAVNIAAGAKIDLAGYDLYMNGLTYDVAARICESKLVANGSFEQVEGAAGTWQVFSNTVYPTGWTAMTVSVATVGWTPSPGTTWSDKLAARDGSRSVWWWCNDNTCGGATLMQKVNVVKADDYRLSFYTAYRPYGGVHKDMRIHVDVDGNAIGYATCSTATWTESVFDVLLDVGEHSITFRSDGTGGGSNPCALLDLVSLRFLDAAITNSNEEAVSELHANFASGWTANDRIALGGNVKLVKEGAGTFASHKAQTYTGGTLVAGGMAQPPDGNGANDTYSPAKGYTAFGSGKIVVGEGAFFDLRGNYDFNGALSIDLDGGTITSGIEMKQPGWGGSGVGTLTKDSFVNVQRAIVFGGGTLDLGGHKLSASMAYGRILYAKYSVISNGTLETSGTGWLRFDASCDMRTVRFVSGSPLALGGDITIELGDYVVSYAGNESNGTGVLKVHGAFVPNTDSFFGCTMQDGSTIDLSGRTTALPAAAAFTGSVKPSHLGVSFAANATVTVNLAGREGLKELAGSKDEGGAFAGYLMMWGDEVPDASVKFVLDAETAERYYLKSTGNGLLLRRQEGLGIFLR